VNADSSSGTQTLEPLHGGGKEPLDVSDKVATIGRTHHAGSVCLTGQIEWQSFHGVTGPSASSSKGLFHGSSPCSISIRISVANHCLLQ
jgi:hypothetical protein